jgi:hypothetical protein
MRVPVRSIVGFSAGAATMAFVAAAVITAPRAEPTLQVLAKCPGAAAESPLPKAIPEAQRPA